MSEVIVNACAGDNMLIIESRFYEDIADELYKGASSALRQAGVRFCRVGVPGALELPLALAMAVDTGSYDGYVILGCVIRGETSHYDIVAGESVRAITNLAVEKKLALGNGILTVENYDQAWQRARVDGDGRNKGRGAALAALSLCVMRRG